MASEYGWMQRYSILSENQSKVERLPRIAVAGSVGVVLLIIIGASLLTNEYVSNVHRDTLFLPLQQSQPFPLTCTCRFGCLVVALGSCHRSRNAGLPRFWSANETHSVVVCQGVEERLVVMANTTLWIATGNSRRVDGMCMNTTDRVYSSMSDVYAQRPDTWIATLLNSPLRMSVKTPNTLFEAAQSRQTDHKGGTSAQLRIDTAIQSPDNFCTDALVASGVLYRGCVAVVLFGLEAVVKEWRDASVSFLSMLLGLMSGTYTGARLLMYMGRRVWACCDVVTPQSPKSPVSLDSVVV
jgi:hypothetical protein